MMVLISTFAYYVQIITKSSEFTLTLNLSENVRNLITKQRGLYAPFS